MDEKLEIWTVNFFDKSDNNFVFSNFYPCTLVYRGLGFASSEHLYQWLKFDTDDPKHREYQEIIRTSSTPYVSKMYGHQEVWHRQYSWTDKIKRIVDIYKPYVGRPENFDEIKVSIMYFILRLKFIQCPRFRHTLMYTKTLEKLHGKRIEIREISKDKFWSHNSGNGALGNLLTLLRDRESDRYVYSDEYDEFIDEVVLNV